MRWLKLSWAVLGIGCGGTPTTPQPDLGPRSTYTEAQAAAARTACTFKAGALPGESLAKDAPIGPQIPIDTVVVVMMENRSFDHLLGNLPATGQPDVEVAAANASNLDSDGKPVQRFHLTDYCFDDTSHEWEGSHKEWNNGKNDGFVVANQGGKGDAQGARAMGYYDQTDLPFLYGLANRFSIADQFFCSVMGPTFPNRMYLYGATSFGYTYNWLLSHHEPNLLEKLEQAGVSWHEYYETFPGSGIFTNTFVTHIGDHYEKIEDFLSAAAAGTLDHFVLVDPNLRSDGALRDDQHPPGDIQLGDQFLEKIVNAVMKSPQWPRLALFITWDEHGGIYDHVPPPTACSPDASEYIYEHGVKGPSPAPGAGFDRLGFRVPLVVVSPYARPHFVSHKVYDHTSITRFVEARFLLGALSARDANADPLYELFDFSKPALLQPPTLPKALVDQAKLNACIAAWPKKDFGDGGLDVFLEDMSKPADLATKPTDGGTNG